MFKSFTFAVKLRCKNVFSAIGEWQNAFLWRGFVVN